MTECTENDINLLNAIKKIAPGTSFRKGLDYILKAELGALIVVEDNQEINENCDGGFNINKEYLPEYLYELSKMDGAIVINRDMTQILSANVNLVTDKSISTNETGTRHQTAERISKQTHNLVISISKRRKGITIYKGNCKYCVRNRNEVISEVNQGIQTLERYKNVFDTLITSISIKDDVPNIITKKLEFIKNRAEIIYKIMAELRIKVLELGEEGKFIKMELEELAGNIYAKLDLIIEILNDYGMYELVETENKFEEMYTLLLYE